MSLELKTRWEALPPNMKRVVVLGGVLVALMSISFLATLFEKKQPKLDKLDTRVEIEMMLPERRDATLDELNASQIAAARRILRLEQNIKTGQKAVQEAVRDLQAQLNTDREPTGMRKMQDQIDYLTRQLRRVETKAARADRRTDELLTEENQAELVGPEEPGGGDRPERVVSMPRITGIPTGEEQGSGPPPDIPDIPAFGERTTGSDDDGKPMIPELPRIPDLPEIPGVPSGSQSAPAASTRARPTMRMVTADGQSEAGGSTDQGGADEMRIPPSSRTRSGMGGRTSQEQLSAAPGSGGGGRTDRELGDRREESRRTENVNVYMPAGAMFSGILLNGVDALTSNAASSSPTPVLIRVKREAIVPNYFTVDIRECFVIASGFGRMSTERLEARTERLSCVRTDGGVIDTRIEGYIIGEDGKVGMRGRLVSRYGAMLTRAGIAGLLSGFSEALKPSYVGQLEIDPSGTTTTTQANPSDVVKGGLYGGVSSTSKEISQFFLDMARETLPTLEVDAGRKATVVILRGTNLELG